MESIGPIPLLFLIESLCTTCVFAFLFLRTQMNFVCVIDARNHSIILRVKLLKSLQIGFVNKLLLSSHVSRISHLTLCDNLAIQHVSIHLLLLFSLILQHQFHRLNLLNFLTYILTLYFVYLLIIHLLQLFFSLLLVYNVIIQMLIYLPVHFSFIKVLIYLLQMFFYFSLFLYGFLRLPLHFFWKN